MRDSYLQIKVCDTFSEKVFEKCHKVSQGGRENVFTKVSFLHLARKLQGLLRKSVRRKILLDCTHFLTFKKLGAKVYPLGFFSLSASKFCRRQKGLLGLFYSSYFKFIFYILLNIYEISISTFYPKYPTNCPYFFSYNFDGICLP